MKFLLLVAFCAIVSFSVYAGPLRRREADEEAAVDTTDENDSATETTLDDTLDGLTTQMAAVNDDDDDSKSLRDKIAEESVTKQECTEQPREKREIEVTESNDDSSANPVIGSTEKPNEGEHKDIEKEESTENSQKSSEERKRREADSSATENEELTTKSDDEFTPNPNDEQNASTSVNN